MRQVLRIAHRNSPLGSRMASMEHSALTLRKVRATTLGRLIVITLRYMAKTAGDSGSEGRHILCRGRQAPESCRLSSKARRVDTSILSVIQELLMLAHQISGLDPRETTFRKSCRSSPRGHSRPILPHYLSRDASKYDFGSRLVPILQPSRPGARLTFTSRNLATRVIKPFAVRPCIISVFDFAPL